MKYLNEQEMLALVTNRLKAIESELFNKRLDMIQGKSLGIDIAEYEREEIGLLAQIEAIESAFSSEPEPEQPQDPLPIEE